MLCCFGRAIRNLHLETCDALDVEPVVKAEVEQLLNNLQQLLIGISIMQVGLMSTMLLHGACSGYPCCRRRRGCLLLLLA